MKVIRHVDIEHIHYNFEVNGFCILFLTTCLFHTKEHFTTTKEILDIYLNMFKQMAECS